MVVSIRGALSFNAIEGSFEGSQKQMLSLMYALMCMVYIEVFMNINMSLEYVYQRISFNIFSEH